jgi:hypothetical protein
LRQPGKADVPSALPKLISRRRSTNLFCLDVTVLLTFSALEVISRTKGDSRLLELYLSCVKPDLA